MGLFDKLKQGLAKTKSGFVAKIEQVFNAHSEINDDLYDELEEILLTSDISVEAVLNLLEALRAQARQQRIKEPTQLYETLKDNIYQMLPQDTALNLNPSGLSVILIVGVNGVGKTTTIGKLALQFKQQGKKVMLAAADTFRAAASDQLTIWAERAGVDIIKHGEGGDPSAVIYDAIHACHARGHNVLLIDTAGRLHNKTNLMNELSKIKRIVSREIPGAPQETLLVIDANTGQNGLYQANAFNEATDVTGIVLTKLDSTAKGGIVVSIAHDYELPIKFVGVGEKASDLQPFDAKTFINALFETNVK